MIRAIAVVAFTLALAAPAQADSDLRVGDLRTGHMENPLGIDDRTPTLSWKLTSRDRDQVQRAYQVRVLDGHRPLWDSGKVSSRESAGIAYAGPALESRQRLTWTVRVWDERNRASDWARPARFEVGLLERSDWTARWIGDPPDEGRQEPLVITFPSRTARYLKLDVTRLGKPLKEGWPEPVSRLQLAELQVFGGGTLRSQGRPVTASESYTVGGAWEPRWITDGTLDSNRNPRGYTSYERHQQDLEAPIWLEIDLGEPTQIDEVRLYPRTDTLTPEREIANFPEDFTLQTRSAASDPWSEAHRADDQAAPPAYVPDDSLPLLARGFELGKRVERARLYAAGLGIYEARLNGRKVGDAVLEPANTDFRKRVQYRTYDVTDELRRGQNTLGFELGRGIYDVPAGSGRYTKFTGSMGPMKAIGQLEVTFSDGSSTTIATGDGWRTTAGPTTFTNWYGGEDHDARRELAGWDAPGADHGDWRPVRDLGAPTAEQVLSAQQEPPVRVQETVTAVSRREVAPGVWLYDLGRNLAGWPQLTVRGAGGETARMLPGEKLADGRVTQAEVGGPVYFRYTAADDGAHTWHPRFMYYGFRYVEVSGLSTPPAVADMRAKVLRADNERLGRLTTSDETLNRTYDMVQRAVDSNMFSVLTDCPHREKLGWLEEYHLLYDTIAGNFDVAAYYRKLARDIRDAQLPDGMVPDIAPEYTVFAGGFRDDPNWGGAVIMVPYKHYRAYGDDEPLRAGYASMQRYMDYLASKADGHILSHGLGDWGAFDTSTPVPIAATTGYHRFAVAMAEIAGVVGEAADAERYRALAADIREAFNARYFDGESYGSGSQASNALPLAAGMVPDEHRATVIAALKRDIAERGDHLSTGEIGLRALFDVLGEARDADTVLAMAKNPTAPSYAAMLASGATTLPEFWDGRGSQNHFMMGAIDDWSYRYLAGIRPTAPGFREFVVAPLVPRDLHYASARWPSAYGAIESAWRKQRGGRLELDVTVPVNTSADVHVPASSDEFEVRVDGRVVWDGRRSRGFDAHREGDVVVLEDVGSGEYEIESRPLERVEPSLALSVSPQRRAAAPGGDVTLTARLEGVATSEVEGSFVAELPEGWSAEPASAPFELRGHGWPEAASATLKVTVPSGTAGGEYPVRVVAEGQRAEAVIEVPSLVGDVFASDLPWLSESNGYGPAERDRSNGELGGADGPPLSVGGTVYEKGIGAHAPSEIVLAPDGRCERFLATVGVNDGRGSNGSVAFRVLADGTEVAATPVLTGASAAVEIDADITGARRVALVVTTGADNNNHDHADWANARIACGEE